MTGSPDAGMVATGGTAGGGTSGSFEKEPWGGSGGASGGSLGSGGSESESSDSGRIVKSGTVTMSATSGATTASCQQLLVLKNPAQPLTGYLALGPVQYQKDPRAGEPSYVYLDAGKDAVILSGPVTAYAATKVDASAPKLTTCVNEEAACQSHDGYLVQVNERLSYLITIEDWEDEIALGQIDLCLNNGSLTAQFIFAGLRTCDGVAHEVTITPTLDNGKGIPTTPITVECRRE
jgi:hypothetical protein